MQTPSNNEDITRDEFNSLIEEKAWSDDKNKAINQHFRFLELLDEFMPETPANQ